MIRRFWLILVWQLILISASAQPFTSPYKLSLAVDIPISTNGVALLGTSYLIGKTWEVPSKQSISLLNRDSINKFDRGATHQNSKVAGYLSDFTIYAAVALPLLQLISIECSNRLYIRFVLLKSGKAHANL